MWRLLYYFAPRAEIHKHSPIISKCVSRKTHIVFDDDDDDHNHDDENNKNNDEDDKDIDFPYVAGWRQP